jgi:predicted Ser/Thr protein kinase
MAVTLGGQPEPEGGRASADGEIKPPRNWTKAVVAKSMRNGRVVAVKDFSCCNALIKILYGRPTLRREARAYGLLQDVSGIPECLGLEGRGSLVIEYIEGRLLGSFKRGHVGPEVFDRVDEIVKRVHARGVALVDLHRSNIIITAQGDVFLIDFAFALFARDSLLPGVIMRFFLALDCFAAARMRARYLRLPKPAFVGLFGVMYRFGRGLKKTCGRIKKLFGTGA